MRVICYENPLLPNQYYGFESILRTLVGMNKWYSIKIRREKGKTTPIIPSLSIYLLYYWFFNNSLFIFYCNGYTKYILWNSLFSCSYRIFCIPFDFIFYIDYTIYYICYFQDCIVITNSVLYSFTMYCMVKETRKIILQTIYKESFLSVHLLSSINLSFNSKLEFYFTVTFLFINYLYISHSWRSSFSWLFM